MRTIVYIDTEFTSFQKAELISIGAVIDFNRFFYAEITDYNKSKCSQFVIDVVLPLVDKHPRTIVGTFAEVAVAFRKWILDNLPDQQIYFGIDYILDLEFAKALLFNKGQHKSPVVHGSWCDYDNSPVGKHEHANYFLGSNTFLHNALDDAFALRRASIAASMSP